MRLAPPLRRRSRSGLTPMIDVIFLLLVFFILSARFGLEGRLEIALTGFSERVAPEGPPRLVDVAPDALRLNGAAVDPAALPGALRRLGTGPSDVIVLRVGSGADLARIVAVMDVLRAAGLPEIALVERRDAPR